MKILNSGDKMNENKWKGVSVFAYSYYRFLPRLFFGCRYLTNKSPFILSLLFIGTSDAIVLHIGAFAFENHQSIIDNIFSWSLLVVLF
jgi:hypothetical protein